MTLRFGQKLPLSLESKVIKSQSRPMSHLKMKTFFRPRGVNLTPPSRIGLTLGVQERVRLFQPDFETG